MAKTKINSLDISTTMSILKELDRLSRVIEETRKKIIMALPAKYGSDLWWEKSDKEAIESIKEGRGKRFKTHEEAVKYLTE